MTNEIPKFVKGEIRFRRGSLESKVYDYENDKYYCAICGEEIDTTKAYMLSERQSDMGTELEVVCHRHVHELSRFPEDVHKILSR